MYVTICEIDRQSMRLGTQDPCTGMTLRDGLGREVGAGFRMGDAGTPMAEACQCMAKKKHYNIVK